MPLATFFNSLLAANTLEKGMGVLFFSLFLGLVGGILVGGITSVVLFFMDSLSATGVWVSVVNSFLAGFVCGAFAGMLKPLVILIAAIFDWVNSNGELAAKLIAGVLATFIIVVFFVSTIGAPIITSRHSETYIWNWPGVRTFEFRLFFESPLDRVDILTCDSKSDPACKVLPEK